MCMYIYITCIYSEHHGSFIKFVFRTIWYALKCDFRLARTMACFCHPRGVTAGITCMTESSDHSMVHFKNWHELNKLKLLPVHHQGDQWAACQCPCCCLPMVGTTKHVLICFPFVTMCFSVFNFCLMCSISFVFTNSQTELCNCYHVATVAPATNFGCPDLGHRMPCLHGKPSTFPVSSNHTRSPLWERPGRHRQGKHRPIIRTGKKNVWTVNLRWTHDCLLHLHIKFNGPTFDTVQCQKNLGFHRGRKFTETMHHKQTKCLMHVRQKNLETGVATKYHEHVTIYTNIETNIETNIQT